MSDEQTWYNSFPISPGYLPKFLLLISAVSVFNTISCYTTTKLTKRVYSGKPIEVNGLSSRTFGTWTIMVALVRFYGAYNISNPAVYDLCIATFLVAGWHFGSEWLYFGTARLGEGLTGPLVVATTGVTWMLTQRSHYLSQV